MEKTQERHVTNSPDTDPRSGFNRTSRTFQSLHPPLLLPPPHAAVSTAAHILSLRRNSSKSNSITAFIDATTGHRLSYGELTHRSETLATNLALILKLSKNDTALILSPNIIRIPILYFALLSLGVVFSPVNPLSTRSELTRLFDLAKPSIVFAVTSLAEKSREFNVPIVLIDSPEFDSLTKTKTPSEPSQLGSVTQSDVAAILYSSGTTGMVKGVMLTHRNLTASAAEFYAVGSKRKNKEFPLVCLYTVPLFHVFGLVLFLGAIALSETVVIMERFRLTAMLGAVERFRVKHLVVVPPLMVALTKDSVTHGYDLTALEEVTCGGAPLKKETAEAFKAKFPNVIIIQGYGLTESAVARTNLEDTDRAGSTGTPYDRAGSTGTLYAEIEAKIVNQETGEAMFPGEQGELWVKGPYVMKGYVGDPEATSTTLVDGWLRTGDLCYFDNDGFLYVVDRLKELIKCKGYQVAPAELEHLLMSHPEINDAAVIRYPDEEAGEVPMAFVVRQPQSSIGKAEIMDFVAKQVAPYKKIRRVAFVNSIPKNAAGKILRKDLSKLAFSKL